jgi:multicomponent Na+:H+ antiporter subunit F
MNILYICVITVLLLCLVGGFIRVLLGPDNSNRMLASQLFGTIGVTIVVVLAFLQDNEVLVNVALIITLLASITVIAFLKLAEQSDSVSDDVERM